MRTAVRFTIWLMVVAILVVATAVRQVAQIVTIVCLHFLDIDHDGTPTLKEFMK